MKELKRIILVFVAIVISIQSVYATNSRIAYDHNLKEKAISEMTEAEKKFITIHYYWTKMVMN